MRTMSAIWGHRREGARSGLGVPDWHALAALVGSRQSARRAGSTRGLSAGLSIACTFSTILSPLPSLSTICSIFNRRDLICSSMLGFAKRHWHSIEAAGSLAKTAKFALLHE